MPVFYIVICGLIVALAVFLIVREIRKMLKGRCCESCKNCSEKENCASLKLDENKIERKEN